MTLIYNDTLGVHKESGLRRFIFKVPRNSESVQMEMDSYGSIWFYLHALKSYRPVIHLGLALYVFE